LGGALDEGLGASSIDHIAPLETASASALAPLLSRTYLVHAEAAATRGALLLVDAKIADLAPKGRRLVHPNAAFALARLLEPLAQESPADHRAHAFVEEGALVHPSARLGVFVVVHAGAEIGEDCDLQPHAVVYGGVRLGKRVYVGASSVLGRPGFGWVASPEGLLRMPQLGGLIIEDDVEIGPLCTIDAGTLGPTRVCRGAKLDAHVHVGHNVEIGAGALVAAQSGFAGSSKLGAFSLVGGQVGVADHCEVGQGARLAAKSGVIGDVPAGATFGGYPAVDKARWLRATARALSAAGGKPDKRKGRA